jgi:hypothetical protein
MLPMRHNGIATPEDRPNHGMMYDRMNSFRDLGSGFPIVLELAISFIYRILSFTQGSATILLHSVCKILWIIGSETESVPSLGAQIFTNITTAHASNPVASLPP